MLGDMEWPLLGDTPTLDRLPVTTGEAVTRAAVTYLHRWSGGVYGLTDATVRPVRTEPAPGHLGTRYGKWQPVAIGGGWYSITCYECGGQFCGCGHPSSLRFPFRVHEITDIRVDGSALEDGAWRLEAHRILHRIDGSWPTWQRLTLPDTAEQTFAIDLVRGLPVPDGGQIAAGVLAEEIAKAVTGDAACRLPARVQTITRQGVTVGMFDSMDDLSGGKTGLWLVDSWLTSVMEAPRVGGIWSPDHDPGRVNYQ